MIAKRKEFLSQRRKATNDLLSFCSASARKIYGSIRSSIEVGSFAGAGGASGGGAPARSEIFRRRLFAFVEYGNAVSILTTPSLIKRSMTLSKVCMPS